MKNVYEALHTLTNNAPAIETRVPSTGTAPATIAEWENSPDLAPFLTFDDPQLIAMRAEAARFLHEMHVKTTPRWLTFLGPSGCGKTFLGDLILAAVRRHRLTKSGVGFDGLAIDACMRMTFEITLERILNDENWDHFARVCDARFAFVDELLHDVLPAKISGPKLASMAERRLGKWTVLTANVGLQTIKEKRDTRVASRMIRGGNVVIDVDVIDFNLR